MGAAVAAAALSAAMDWQAAIAQMAAMMSLVWMFTVSPFVFDVESFPYGSEYIIAARIRQRPANPVKCCGQPAAQDAGRTIDTQKCWVI
jgi:hypothetical protein